MSASVIPMPPCRDCGRLLTMEEHHYYEYRCEGCEAAWHARLQAWRRGAPDPVFDAMFGTSEVNKS